jgi:hypothetical protein
MRLVEEVGLPHCILGHKFTVCSQPPNRRDGKLRITDTSRLACSETEHYRGFAALSYVWDTNQTFVLLSTTIDEFMSGFDVQKLPQTIQDAVTVARRLGFRHLWVDALCIMQDSDADKAVELPKMRRIYQKASVAIVVGVSKAATEGFLHTPIETSYFIDPITIPYHHLNKSSSKGRAHPELSCILSPARVDQPHSVKKVALKPRAKEYIAPTWSWASIVGEIEDRASDVARKSGSEYLDFSIVSCEVEYVMPEFKYGAVSSGTLVVKGRVRSFFRRSETSLELVSCDGYLSVREENDPYPETMVGEVWIDELEPEVVDGCIVDCLAMSLVEPILVKRRLRALCCFLLMKHDIDMWVTLKFL